MQALGHPTSLGHRLATPVKGRDEAVVKWPNPCLTGAFWRWILEHETKTSSQSQKPSEHRGLLYILVSAFAFLSGWFLSRRTPNQDASESIHPEDTPGVEGKLAPRKPATVSEDPPTPNDSPTPDKRTGDTTPSWKKCVEISAVFIALGLLAVNFFQMRATNRAADAAKLAAETATKDLELSQRPWVSLDNFTIESPLKFDSSGSATIIFGFEVKNTGRSPAIRGFWQEDFFLQFGERPSPVKKRDDACNFAVYGSTKVTDPRIAETWFPGNGLPRRIGVAISAEDIAKALQIPKQVFPAAPHAKEFDYIYPDLVVCVAYRAAFTDTQYHTGYILELMRSNAKISYISPMKSGEIPASELKLAIHPFYGIDAN